MTNIVNHLEELQEPSRKWLPGLVVTALQEKTNPRKLVRNEVVAHANTAIKPIGGADSLSVAKNRQSARRTMTLPASMEDNKTYELNSALLKDNNYPILTTVLGAAAGFVSGGGALIFAATTTGISLSRKAQRVLARPGDEIWSVEEIGKYRSAFGYKPMYVYALIIVDPYRKQAWSKGWLIHEERHELTLG